jgi:hypothetical protein
MTNKEESTTLPELPFSEDSKIFIAWEMLNIFRMVRTSSNCMSLGDALDIFLPLLIILSAGTLYIYVYYINIA